MEVSKKLPLKRVELSLTKFNEVAIPHHLDLLRQHRANIIKYEQCGELQRVRSEQTNARRVAAQMRTLLREMEMLRSQVLDSDLTAFDKLTLKSRDQTHKAIVDYLESAPVSMSGSFHQSPVEPAVFVSGSAISTDSVGLVAHQSDEESSHEGLQTLTQLQIEKDMSSLAEREAVLRGWTELQEEVRQLKDVWEHVQQSAVRQREQVERAAGSVEQADVVVAETRSTLFNAEKLRAAWYPMAGLVVGGVLGGPVGLVVGLKAAAVAALAGSVLGYTGVATLVKRRTHASVVVDDSKKDN